MVSLALSPVKSLWSYNPIPFGCVFYAPLWHPNLSSDNFKSIDPYGRTCIVTGAVLGAKGRVFDGDDKIAVNSVAANSFFDGTFTLMAWGKLTDWSANRQLIAAGKGDISAYATIDFNGTDKKFYTRTQKTLENTVGSSITYNNDSNWYFFAALIDADGHIDDFSINGASQGSNSTTVNDLSTIDEFNLGALPFPTNFWIGTIGEGWVYNRELSLIEINHVYNATKWRY